MLALVLDGLLVVGLTSVICSTGIVAAVCIAEYKHRRKRRRIKHREHSPVTYAELEDLIGKEPR